MKQQEIHQYLEQFFNATGCVILESSPGHIAVQLTKEMDKELMNRPFYWTYIEKTGGTATPMKITFVTDADQAPKGVDGEFIHFGSPRLHQIFAAARKMGGYLRLYEERRTITSRNTALHPWLFLNMKISYCSDRRKDFYRSFGLNLINGMLQDHFDHKTETLPLTPRIPDYCFTISPVIRPVSGIKRIERMLTEEAARQDLSWASKSREKLSRDLALLEQFYVEEEKKPETYWIEKKALTDQYSPYIEMKVINGGLLYLASPPA